MRLAVLPGDDIGPEITEATLTVLNVANRAFNLGLEYDVHEVGMQAHKRYGTTLPRYNSTCGPGGRWNCTWPGRHDGLPTGVGRRH
jgi:isocitrate/isopropylmalate dehydrogenase